jgi:RNA recognition motif-containing protein
MQNIDQPFRINRASFSMGDKHSNINLDHSIFVGDLSSDSNTRTFFRRYSSFKGAKFRLMLGIGRTKGYIFVRSRDDSEKTHAMTERNEVHCSTRPMMISPATLRKSSRSVKKVS